MLTIETDNRILHATARENSRFALSDVGVRIKDGRGVIAATDGRIAAVRPVQTLNGTSDASYNASAMISREALGKNATKNAKRLELRIGEEPNPNGAFAMGARVDSSQVSGNGKARKSKPLAPGSVTDGELPPIDDVLPRSGRYATINVNPDLLNAAMQAARDTAHDGRGVVTLYVPIRGEGETTTESDSVKAGSREVMQDTGRPIVIVGDGPDAGAALAMPISSKETDHVRNFKRADDLFRATK